MTQFSSSTFGRYAGFWLIVTAAIELALAAVFVVIGLTVPFVDWGMYLTAAILGVTGFILLLVGLRVRRSAAANEALLRDGIGGQAMVTGLSQTGMYLNENPQVAMNLLVQLPGRDPYPATRKEFVPLILLGRLSSGAPLPVKVDPADPQRLIIDWGNAGLAPMGLPTTAMGGAQMSATAAQFGATPTGFETLPGATVDESLDQVKAAMVAAGVAAPAPFATAGQGSFTLEQLRAYLRQAGLEGFARIDRLTDTGKIVGNERLYTMALTLELPGQLPEPLSESAAMVPLTAVSKVRVGARVPVRVAPDNHQLTMFEWEKL